MSHFMTGEPETLGKTSLLVLLLCLCKSFKELFSFVAPEVSSSKAGAKVRLFSEPPKLFRSFFAFYRRNFSLLDFRQAYL